MLKDIVKAAGKYHRGELLDKDFLAEIIGILANKQLELRHADDPEVKDLAHLLLESVNFKHHKD